MIGTDYPDPYAEETLELLTTEQLANLPAKQAAVNGLVSRDSLTWIVGDPGSYKSFFAMDMALSVASGVQFYGRAVEPMPVVYVTGEGRSGLWHRVQAWKEGRNGPDRALWYPEGIHALGEWWPRLTDACVATQAGMVFLDTQANMTAGMDENSAQEMGTWVQALQKLQRATGAAVCVVHHSSKQGAQMRGSSVMHGSADSVFSLHRHNTDPFSPCKVTTPKQKDLPQAEAWWVKPMPVLSSIVLSECEPPHGA